MIFMIFLGEIIYDSYKKISNFTLSMITPENLEWKIPDIYPSLP